MPKRGGMGDGYDQEDYRYGGYRDFGQEEPDPNDAVYEPNRNPNAPTPGKQQDLDTFFNRFREELKKLVFFTKFPAFVQPSFFAKKFIKVAEKAAIVPGAGFTNILDFEVPARQRLVVTAIGIDTDKPAQVDNHEVCFEFNFPTTNTILQIFDDQTPTSELPGGYPTPLTIGQTTIMPGSIADPFCLKSNGLEFQIEGPGNLIFRARNDGAENIRIRALMGFYRYWLPKASEFEGGDLQV